MTLALLLAMLLIVSPFPGSGASASKTYEVFSVYDSSDAKTASQYNLTYISVAEWSEHPGDIVFYLFFATQISQYMFNDNGGSWAGAFIDTNSDGNDDISVVTNNQTYPLDNTLVPAYAAKDGRNSGCTAVTWSNINEGAKWIGFKVSKSCLGLPTAFAVQGYADYIENDDLGFDYAPESRMAFRIPTSATTTTTTTTTPVIAQAPNAPASLAVSMTSDSSLHLTWIDNSTNEDGFIIQRDDLQVPAGTTTTAWPYKTAANVASWDVTGLATAKRYCFAIAAYNSAGASRFTDWGCIDLGGTASVATTAPQLTCDAARGKKSGTTIVIAAQTDTANAGRKLSFEAYANGKWVKIGSARVTAAGLATLKAKVSVVRTKGVVAIRATQGSRFICEGNLR